MTPYSDLLLHQLPNCYRYKHADTHIIQNFFKSSKLIPGVVAHSVILALRSPRQDDSELKTSLGNTDFHLSIYLGRQAGRQAGALSLSLSHSHTHTHTHTQHARGQTAKGHKYLTVLIQHMDVRGIKNKDGTGKMVP